VAKLLGSKCKRCRREGIKLFLKGRRCETVRCVIDKKPQPPGQHGAKRVRLTDYGRHLREKQRLKRLYGLSERQFKRYFTDALHQTGNTGENLLVLLERRLDNVLYAGRFTNSRSHARQLITHGHIVLNDKRTNIPSALVEAGNIIKPLNKDYIINQIKKNLESANKEMIPTWLKVSEEPLQLQVVQLPKKSDITVPINEQLIVEFSSR